MSISVYPKAGYPEKDGLPLDELILHVEKALSPEDAAKCILKDLWLGVKNSIRLWELKEEEVPGSDGGLFQEMIQWARKNHAEIEEAVCEAGMMDYLRPWAEENGFFAEMKGDQ